MTKNLTVAYGDTYHKQYLTKEVIFESSVLLSGRGTALVAWVALLLYKWMDLLALSTLTIIMDFNIIVFELCVILIYVY